MPEYTCNPLLETRAPEGWMGTRLDKAGRFVNLNYPFWPEFSKLLKWQISGNPQRKEKKSDIWLPDFQPDTSFLDRKDDCLVWLGHSSFFLRLAGTGILIDPVFGNASVVRRKIPFPHSHLLAREAEYLLISHDHRDHCDAPSLKAIAHQNPDIQVLTGLKMAGFLGRFFPLQNIKEAGWYQRFDLKNSDIRIWFLPARHWSRRWLSDTNQRLWGSFHISAPGQSIYFMGDSGLDDHFAEIGKLFPKAKFALMGIGAYSPAWFMHSSHMSPEESWSAFGSLGAETFIPMHYGTYDLADEPPAEPLNRLKNITPGNRLLIPAVGQTIWI